MGKFPLWLAPDQVRVITSNDDAALIGSEFERTHGWHVNLMPEQVLREFPAGWEERATTKTYGLLSVNVPSAADLLVPKRKRNEPRDRAHAAWAESLGMLT